MSPVCRRRARLGASAVLLALTLPACVRTLPVDPALLGGQAVTSDVVDANGRVITSLHAEEDRRPLALAQIPGVLVDAVIAIEDRRFYEHDGVDVRGIARAAARDVRAGSAKEGGSTITQQLVKNTLVTPERDVRRKVREAALALGLERSLTKDQILERYLNTVYFGQGAYGVGAASRVYFGHPADKLTLPEAALLAGLIRSPTRADPLHDAKAARARRGQVLDAMVATGAATTAEAATARAAALPTRAFRDTVRYPAAFAVQDAVSELLDDRRLGATPEERRNALFRGGLKVHLTIDLDQQRQAEQAVAAVLTDTSDPAAGIAAVKPGDGAITALVGGRDFFSTRDPQAKVNLARGGSTKRQAGSTFKVFTLIAALEAGVEPEDRFEAGAAAVLPCRCGEKKWQIDNYEGVAFGRITLRKATESSVNTAYARVVQRVGDGDVDRGVGKVVDVAERLGVRGARESRLRREPAVTLGAQEVDPVQMAAAYATLAAGGIYARPYLVAQVTDARGRLVLRNTPAPKRVLTEGLSALANDILQGVVQHGTGVRARLPRPVAGKTGTSTKYRDAWFVGYTPNFAAAVWLGVPARQVAMTPENGFRTVIAGGTFPALIWGRFAGQALIGLPVRDFGGPDGAVVRVELDAERGCRPNQWTPRDQIVTRRFLKGAEPTAPCTEPTGPPATVVPPLLGLAQDQATLLLSRAGFRSAIEVVYDPNYPPGVVVGQQPPSGTTVRGGATVTVRVSGGRLVDVVVPDVLGLDAESALTVLGGSGLRGRVVVEPSCSGARSCDHALARDSQRVWRSDLRGGSRVPVGSVVTLSVGPAYSPAPPTPSPTPTPVASPTPTPTPSAAPPAATSPSATPPG